MSDLQTWITVNLKGNIEDRARRYTRAMTTFSRSSRQQMRLMKKTFDVADRGLGRVANRYTGALTGAAGARVVSGVAQHQRRLTRLGIQANVSSEMIAGMNDEIFRTARMPDIRVDAGQIISSIESIIEKTGDLEFARNNIRNIGLALQATGASGPAIGELLAEFQKMDIKNPKEVMQVLDTLNVQGKEGAFTLQNLAALGPRVFSAYSAGGRNGAEAVRELGAALQVIRQGTGSSEQAATAFEAVLRSLQDPAKILKLQKNGIQVFDEENLKAGKEVIRPINELIVDIIKASRGKTTKLATVFDAEAMRAFNAPLAEFNRSGNVESLRKFMSVTGDGTTTLRDSARAANDAAGAWQNLVTAMGRYADKKLTGTIQSVANATNELSEDSQDSVIGSLAAGAGGIIATGFASKFLPRKFKKRLGRLARRGVMKSGKLGLSGLKGLANKSLLGRAGAAGLAFWVGDIVGTLINDHLITGTEFGDNLGGTLAQIMASMGSDEAQAALDSQFKSMPNFSPTHRRINAVNNKFQQQPKRDQVSGTIRVKIDSEGRPTIRELQSHGIQINAETGYIMGTG